MHKVNPERKSAARSGAETRCPNCGRFCNVVYRWRGPAYMEVTSCLNCGINPPKCVHEDGSVTGCPRNATHEVPGRNYQRYWCKRHAPDEAEILPYAEAQANAL